MEKTKLKIRHYGDPVLAHVARRVQSVTAGHRRLLSEMARLMYEVSGVGLAAPQVGVSEALCVIDVGSGLFKIVNPRIIQQDGVAVMEEGCLSLPGVGVSVRRAAQVTVEAWDEDGKPFMLHTEGLLARAFQHELDHLNGVLIIDHATVLQRKKILHKIKNFLEIG